MGLHHFVSLGGHWVMEEFMRLKVIILVTTSFCFGQYWVNKYIQYIPIIELLNKTPSRLHFFFINIYLIYWIKGEFKPIRKKEYSN